MPKCTAGDLAALEESGPLLRFAAEHVKDLNPDLSLAIAEANAAAESDQWTPQVSQRFWTAFAKLCDQIQPVTMDCLAAGNRDIAPPAWRRFFGAETKSIAEQSSGRYLVMLFVVLLFILPIQLYVWTCTNLSKKIDDLLTEEKLKYATLVQEFIKLDTETKDLPPEKWSADQRAGAGKISIDSSSIHDGLDKVDAEQRLLKSVSLGALHTVDEDYKRPRRDAQWYDHYNSVTDRMSATQAGVQPIQEKANLIVGVLGAYILPILFGTIGAIAYVIRSISDQIRTSTFATNSPIRHLMRTALGAMVGLVVGLFSDLSTKFSLSPLAVAFLAGYGVEAVFSMFDGIIEKFKQAKSTP